MTTLDAFLDTGAGAAARRPPPKEDWPLMGDVATVRAGVPEALILWRRARGEALPEPQLR
jgi:hypothetical protein